MRSITKLLCMCALLVPLAPSLAQDTGESSREQMALAEEQLLLQRKLSRLWASMQSLAERFETEGRSHAARLLRDGLEHLEARHAQNSSRTLEELMNAATEGLSGGRTVESIEEQQAIVTGLERLLAILMDRPDVDEMERAIEQLERFQRTLDGLKSEESQLRQETAQLRQDSKNQAQRELEAALEQMLGQQNDLLRRNEQQARDSGALQLEEIQRRLGQLIEDQEVDTAVAGDWQPAEYKSLAGLQAPLSEARRSAAEAERAREAADSLRESARALRAAQGSEELARTTAKLEAEAERAELRARAADEEGARQLAETRRQAAAAARAAAGTPAQREQAAQEIEALATALERSASEQQAAVDEALADSLEQLQGKQGEGSSAELARELARSLEQAAGEPASEEEINAVLGRLRRSLDEASRLAEALEGSQEHNARRAEELSEALGQGGSKAAEGVEAAREALARAAQQARSASQSAAQEQAGETADQAQAASQEMRTAAEALAGAIRGAVEQAAGELGAEQEALAEALEQLEPKTEAASLSESAKEQVQSALQRAAESMKQAAESLSQSQSGAAAREQRSAAEALQEAARESDAGTQSQEAQAEADELARRQEEIAKKLYDFRREYEQSVQQQNLDSLPRGQQAAESATDHLERQELSEAESQEKRVEQAIDEALSDLEAEKRKYQSLRDEELLFEMAEEVDSMIVEHTAAMEETRELNAGREEGARASRSQRLKLRKLARIEDGLAKRCQELGEALLAEDSVVFAELLGNAESDLVKVAEQMGEVGRYASGLRVQARQEDVLRSLQWLKEALEEEKQREQEQQQEQDGGSEEEESDPENRLVPNVAELKLLKRINSFNLGDVEELLAEYPELEEGGEVHPLILEDISRLARRHERCTELFIEMRRRLGIPDPTLELPPIEDRPTTDREKDQ